MAIFGAGSNWNGAELKNDFFQNHNFVIGWDYENAKDLFNIVSLLKAGDIIYLKANQAGSRRIRVKGIGIVTKSFIHYLIENKFDIDEISDWNNFSIPVVWLITKEFFIQIPENEGKLTNMRSPTFFEENLPFVQNEILNKLFNYQIKKMNHMDYALGQFVTGIISVGLQAFQIWKDTRNPQSVRETLNQLESITNSQEIVREGKELESLIPFPVLNTLKNRVEICWTDYNHAVSDMNILPRQLDRYTEGLRQCICRELSVIIRLNGKLPNETMKKWWKEYGCEK